MEIIGIFFFGLLALVSIIGMFKAISDRIGCGCLGSVLAFIITVLAVMLILLSRFL